MKEQDIKTRLRQVSQEIGAGIIGSVATSILGIIAYLQLTDLEAGKVEYVRVLSPAGMMYRILGFWGAISVYIVAVIFCLVLFVIGWMQRKSIVSQIGESEFRRILTVERQNSPRLLRSTDDAGRYPKSTIFLAVVLILLFMGAFVAFKMGIIH